MNKKVFELAKEMGIESKELLKIARELGIKVKTHMSILNEADIKKIQGVKEGKIESKATSSKKKPAIGKPVIDESFFENKHKAPVGKPVVDESMFERKAEEKQEKEAEKVEASEAREAPKAETPKQEVEASKKADSKESAPKVEKKAEKKPEAKEAKKETAKVAPKKEAPKTKEVKLASSEQDDIPKIKIVRTAEEERAREAKVQQQVANRNKERAERSKESAGGGKRRNDRNDSGRSERSGNRFADKKQSNDSRDGSRKKFDDAPKRSNRIANANSNSPSESAGESKGKNGRRKPFKDNNEHNKFDKFERKSLEKNERKKYKKTAKEVEEIEEEILPEGSFKISVPITIAGFCEQTEVSTSKVIMALMKMGVMANINQEIDEETVMILADEIGITVVTDVVEEVFQEEGIEDFEDDEKDLKPRPPIITVMGHVDHGKTSILDAIRNTHVTAGESGGITQHIGASEIVKDGKKIVFLDTPGHEAFTAMRARGAHITDIAVLVVAADDSVKPQTIESISHAKAAGVPIIVAINKMDKPGANPDLVKQDLAQNGVLVEDWGGDVISVPVSAKTGEGIEELLEMILLQADMLELKANPNRLALGSVIEARLDKAKGPVATLLVLNGTIRAGQSLVAGTCSGRIRLMTDSRGKKLAKAGPATAVEILGLTDVPQAGDEFNIVKDDKTAREIAEHRATRLREETMARNSSMSLEKLFSTLSEGEVKELKLIIKADVQGSVGALISSLEKLNNDSVHINVIHSGVGTVNESDIMLAQTADAVILGFNVRPSSAVTSLADRDGVEIRLYTVIYDAINDVEAAMKGMLDPDIKEEMLGKAEVRDTFKVPGVGVIAGAYITEGKVARNAEIRLVRDGIIIHEGKISSLKRFKDDAKEVNQGFECGLGIEDYNDIKLGDIIECFQMVEVKAE